MKARAFSIPSTKCSPSPAKPHIRAEISHIKLSGNAAWNQADKVLAAIESARAEGLDITEDQYAYTASSTGISQLVPDAALEGGHRNFSNASPTPNKRPTSSPR